MAHHFKAYNSDVEFSLSERTRHDSSGNAACASSAEFGHTVHGISGSSELVSSAAPCVLQWLIACRTATIHFVGLLALNDGFRLTLARSHHYRHHR